MVARHEILLLLLGLGIGCSEAGYASLQVIKEILVEDVGERECMNSWLDCRYKVAAHEVGECVCEERVDKGTRRIEG